MRRSLKIFWVLLMSLSLIAFMGGSYPLMASSSPSHSTHFDSVKGPSLPLNGSGCYVCHAAGDEQCVGQPLFADDLPLGATQVCDDCHSPEGAFPGGDPLTSLLDPNIGAKANWTDGVYESGGEALKAGKEQWCATCHDDEPPNSKKDGSGVDAPNVIGEDLNGDDVLDYGYYESGHGRPTANLTCDVCHDLTRSHIDHDPRTFDVDETVEYPVAYEGKEYVVGYRLHAGLDVPRLFDNDGQFDLCQQCHTVVFSLFSNFRFDRTDDVMLHGGHMNCIFPEMMWDSDADGVQTLHMHTGDSIATCPTCHNVHGAPMCVEAEEGSLYGDCIEYIANPVMIRHGELTGSTPSFDFRWFDDENGSEGFGSRVPDRDLSESGEMYCGPESSCARACHQWLPHYDREPLDTTNPTIVIDAVWVTDLDDNPITDFHVNEYIRTHVTFTITGPYSYYVKSMKPNSKIRQEGIWEEEFASNNATLSAGTYEDFWRWNKTIPVGAQPGEAEAMVKIKMFDTKGGIEMGSEKKTITFNIVE